MSRTTRILVCLLLVCSLVSVAGVTAGRPATEPGTAANEDTNANASTEAEPLNRTFVLSLTPETSGTVRVRLQFEVPDGVTSLSTTLSSGASVTDTEGFQHSGGDSYEWTQTTDTPSITYDLPVNQSYTRGREGAETTGQLYADAGEWAIAPAPRAGVSYSGTGPQPEITTGYEFTGSGVTGGDIVYLGDFTAYERTAAGQRLRLVVPAAAELHEEPKAVLDALAGASKTISFGLTDPEVVAIAAPTTVNWASTGLQRGAADFWVLDDRRLDTANNVWVHEYAHTRQTYSPTAETRWSVEGMADYYAALVAYRQGHINYDQFRNHLNIGRHHEDVILSEPDTWEGSLANYDKGALVLAALDRRIRLETDGEATVEDVIRRFNDSTVSQEEFLDAVEATAGSNVRDDAKRYTETDTAPETWTRQEHAAAFGDGRAAFDYEFTPPYDRSGPYRADQVDASPSVVVGESLDLRVAVENTGAATGDYRAALRVDGQTVATRQGTLDPGARERLRFNRTFSDAGEVTLTVGEATETVTVRQPASPRVSELDAPKQARAGEPVELRATVENGANRPARGTVTLATGGQTLASEEILLGVGETATLTATTSFEAGDHAVTAGDRERTIQVSEKPSTSPTDGDASTGADRSTTRTEAGQTATGADKTPAVGQPGFGVAAALAALAAVAALGFGSARRRK